MTFNFVQDAGKPRPRSEAWHYRLEYWGDAFDWADKISWALNRAKRSASQRLWDKTVRKFFLWRLNRVMNER